ncbi:MAG: hypothetical protein Ta2E_01560 [Mycoplasmoidaceae bacterium]|nr:MAG: hypothetical protein Ta2E_01560 [Mycoplasmoidaceae bacterium]
MENKDERKFEFLDISDPKEEVHKSPEGAICGMNWYLIIIDENVVNVFEK